MSKKYTVLAFLFYTLTLSAQPKPYNQVIIWRGFEHKWSYNHRCNRIGDYVTYNQGSPTATHLSATGIGADSTWFRSYYTLINTPNIAFKEGCFKFRIQTKLKRLADSSFVISIPCDDWLQDKDRYATLLNGFDLRSENAADKIQLLKLSVEDAVYNKDSQQLTFKVNYSLVLDCQSVECPDFDRQVDYKLDIYYLIAGFNQADANATEKLFTLGFSWDKKADLNRPPEQEQLYGDLKSGFKHAAIGIRSFSVTLNEAHWLLQFNSNLRSFSYDPESARADIMVDLLFKEWQEGMKANSVSPKQSEFSSKRKGWTVMDMDVVLLQFKKGDVVNKDRSGTMFWRGRNQLPQKSEAESTQPISID